MHLSRQHRRLMALTMICRFKMPAPVYQVLGFDEHMSRKEVAKALKMSRQNVTRIETRALNKLRAMFLARGYKVKDFQED